MGPDIRLLILCGIWSAVVYNQTILKLNDSGGVLIRDLGIVSDHYNQSLARNLFYEVHYLYAGIGIESAGRLVRE